MKPKEEEKTGYDAILDELGPQGEAIKHLMADNLIKDLMGTKPIYDQYRENPLEEIGFIRQDEMDTERWVREDGSGTVRFVSIRKSGSIVCDLEPYQVTALLKYLDQKAGKKEPGQGEVIHGLIIDEYERANAIFPPFASEHEGWAVLYEEVSEANCEVSKLNESLGRMWELVQRHKRPGILAGDPIDTRRMELSDVKSNLRRQAVRAIEELIQVAAMCNKMSDVIWPGEDHTLGDRRSAK